MSRLTIVMYHYVRPLARTRFPGIKGLDTAAFDEQLAYLRRHYELIDMARLLAALDGQERLPARAALLTFDDGVMDHYTNVFPRLEAIGASGVFFPPASVALDRTLLDVHKVHYILASGANVDDLVAHIEGRCAAMTDEWQLAPRDAYRAEYCVPSRFDPGPVVYVKRMLQHALPQGVRSTLTGELFRRYVTTDEATFAEELYMSMDQLRVMREAGMSIGSHGDAHYWLGRLDRPAQEQDIRSSLRLLEALDVPPDLYTISYPYGDYNTDTVELLRDIGFKAGFTTECALAGVAPSQRYTLARLDTNDLPVRHDAEQNEWTRRAYDGSAS